MTGSNSFWFAQSDTGFYNDVIGQSLRFEQGDSPDLALSGLSGGSNTTGTISFWCKRGDLSDDMRVWSNYAGSGSDRNQIGFLAGDTLTVQIGDSVMRTTTRKFRDTTSWYHIVVAFDSTQGTADNRIKVYVNGVQETAFDYSANPSEDAEIFINNDKIYWGRRETSSLYFDGYLAECIQIDGSQLTPTSFGEFSNGVWIPKAYSGSYSNNSYRLTFKKEAASATGYSHYFSGSSVTFSHASHYDIGSSDDFTLELFHKSAMTDAPYPLGYYQTAGPHFVLQFYGTGNVYFYTGNGAAHTFTMGGDASYTANAWNHTAIVRSSGTTKCYINGYQTTAGTTSYSDTTAWDTDRFGIANGSPGNPAFTGYISNVRLVVGSAVYTSNFTPSTTPLTNITNTKLLACQTATTTKDNSSNDVTGSVSGTVVAYTDSPFTGGSPFYHDKSGEGNHFTHTNLLPSDVVADSPENNFATGIGMLSPNVDSQSYEQSVWSEGNLKFVATAAWNNGQSTFGFTSGKWYAECRVNALYSGSGYFRFGMKASPDRTYDEIFWLENGNAQVDATTSPYSDNVGTYTTGDIIQIAVDLDSSTRAIWFGKNGTWENSATESEIEAGTTTNAFIASNTLLPINDGYTYFLYAQGHGGTTSGTWNFGQDSTFAGTETAGGYQDSNNIGDFKYSVPDGFLAQCSQNRSEPSLGPNSAELPNQHYQNYLFTGHSNSTRTISGLNFQPDLLWAKARNQTFSHRIYDSTRGADKGFVLAAGATLYATESTHDIFDGFTSDGYRTTTDGSAGDLLNYNTGTYINWLWKANAGTTTTNDASATSVGDIDSVYQANTTAGFSIVQYTGTGSAGGIAHGLGAVPHFILIKNRTFNDGNNSGTNWVVYHRHMDPSEPQDYSLYISTVGRGDYVNMFNDTAHTSTTFSVGTHMTVNSGDPNYYMAYVWTEIKNFSKFGLYEGTGNIDGPYVFTGFRPALLVVKNRDTTGWWAVSDSGRSTFNEVANTLAWDQGYSESGLTSDLKVDFLSNGFKIRDTDGYYNTDGAEYIYAAWAEMPAKYANAF